MKFTLDQFEKRIQKLVEDNLGKLFPSEEFSSTLVVNLLAALRKSEEVDLSGTRFGAHHYVVFVNPSWLEKDPLEMQERLAGLIRTTAAEEGLFLAGEPQVGLVGNPTLGRFDARAIALQEHEQVSQTKRMKNRPENQVNHAPDQFGGYLITPTKETFFLTLQVTAIGRDSRNHLIIDDERISLLHAQIRAIDGQYLLFDAGSSGGTYVNDEQIAHRVLYPGDVLSFAGVQFVFGQEDVDPDETTQRMQSI